jgi:hypothetical protein
MHRPHAAASALARPHLVVGVLIALCALRMAACFLPTGYLWGLNFARDVSPALAWPLMLALVAALLASLGLPRAVGAPSGIGSALFAAWPWLLGSALVLLLALVPDRQHFVGDFVIRLGILESRNGFERIFPQALPLDRALNHLLPIALGHLLHVEPALVLRGLGLVEAALLVMLSVRFARRVATSEGTAFLVAIALCCGGYATLYSGYSKPTTQVILCTIAVGTLGWEWVTRGTGGLGLALATAFGLAIHRGGLPLLVPFVAAHVLSVRRGSLDATRGDRVRRMGFLLLPLLVLAWEAPRLLDVIRGFDLRVNFAPAEVQQQGGVWRAAFAPLRLLDDVNALLLHAPLAPLALVALAGAWRSREGVFLLALLAAFLPVLLFVFLPLGPFRDYDSLGGAGASLALASAWAIARLPGGSGEQWPRGLAVAVAASVVIPLLLIQVSLANVDRGFARALAIAQGPPRRSATQRASLLDWAGLRALNEERYDVADQAFRELCRETPIPHALKLWGASALIVGETREAEHAFTQLLAGSAADPVGWYGLWMSASLAGDTSGTRRAGATVRTWNDSGPEMRAVVEFMDHYPRLYARVPGNRGAPTR